jgi:hypothetical protein
MFLLYIDASGTPEQQDASRHYALLGICVHEGTWFALNRRIDGLKRRYRFSNDDFEIHAKQFTVSISEQGQIPDFENMSWTDRRTRVLAIRQQRIDAENDPHRKRELRQKYKRTEAFIHLSRLERSRLLEDALDLVGAHEGIRLFGEAIFKAHPGVVGGQIDPVGQAFEQVVSRFDAFLQRRHQWKQASSRRPSIDNGLLILDQDYSTEASLQKTIHQIPAAWASLGRLASRYRRPLFRLQRTVAWAAIGGCLRLCGASLPRQKCGPEQP